MAVRRKLKKETNLNKFLRSKAFPITVSFCLLGFCFVLTRMKRIEQDYAYNDIRKNLLEVSGKIKELRAEKAELLSIKNLREIAKNYKLKEPDHNHIILIP